MKNPSTTEQDSTTQQDFPEFWEWDKDGDVVAGSYVEFVSIPTAEYGEKPAVVLSTDDGLRTVPLWHTALFNRFRDEIGRRSSGELEDGEMIKIARGKKEKSASGRTYQAYKVAFPDAPKRSAKDIFGASDPIDSPPVAYDDTQSAGQDNGKVGEWAA